EQLRLVGVEPTAIYLEPVGRNTAPAIAIAALAALARDPNAILLVLPSDHVVKDVPAFRADVAVAAVAARAGRLVTFGIKPTEPETGYGYIQIGGSLAGLEPCRVVARFVEKPDRARAEAYLAAGDHLWNSGMFAFSAQRLIEELDRHRPGIVAAGRRALDQGTRDLDFIRLERDAFATAEAVSIDYAVMEKTDQAAVVPATFGWSDVGAFEALWRIAEADANGNVAVGNVVAIDGRNNYLRSDVRLLAALGIENLVVVVTEDAVLVTRRDRAQDVKALVAEIERHGRSEGIVPPVVHRPWGSYQRLDGGDRFQVKQIVVRPGGRLSLQKHAKRAEHWVVVNGVARVTCGDRIFVLNENESTFIPKGTVHRLENPGHEPLRLIEVQSGVYLGEDDIVRLDDSYGRS
ncbi:MAG: mannose-1-phosphate guanylyltransferase/mannose-6-phosphate isomerase, partial [Alphaproteobacteria bacterium]|nr:mannose-1-phosphate guanylyltransferase/mannose-6-phosphate isomerase [Alphaproteobacteria bacterium]